MPAKTVFRPIESPHIQGLFIDHSFEQNLLRDREKRERHKVTLSGAPLSAVLGAPLTIGRASQASNDSNPKGCPEGHHAGGLMIKKGIRVAGGRVLCSVTQVMAVCGGTRFRLLGATDREAAYICEGISEATPQSFPIARFCDLMSDRLMFTQVHDRVYQVVTFAYPDGTPFSVSAR